MFIYACLFCFDTPLRLVQYASIANGVYNTWNWSKMTPSHNMSSFSRPQALWPPQKETQVHTNSHEVETPVLRGNRLSFGFKFWLELSDSHRLADFPVSPPSDPSHTVHTLPFTHGRSPHVVACPYVPHTDTARTRTCPLGVWEKMLELRPLLMECLSSRLFSVLVCHFLCLVPAGVRLSAP